MAYSIGIKPFALKGEENEAISRNDKLKWEYNMKAFTGATPAWTCFLPGGNYDTWLPLDEDLGRGIIVHPITVNDPTDCSRQPHQPDEVRPDCLPHLLGNLLPRRLL